MYATDCRGWMECPSSYRNGQVEKLVRITAGHQLNTGQHFTPAGAQHFGVHTGA